MPAEFRFLRLAFGLMVVSSGVWSDAVSPSSAAIPPEAASTGTEAAGGLRLTQDRQVDQWLDAARGHLERDEVSLATGLLARALNAETDSFAADGSSLVIAREAAWRLMNRLPEETRTRLEADLDRTAAAAWTDVQRDGSLDQIASFAVRHRNSPSGLDALRTLAAAKRDANQHEQAAVAWANVAEHPRATLVQRTSARLARLESLMAAGRYREAEQLCLATAKEDLAATIALAGEAVSTREWLAARHRELAMRLAELNDSPREMTAALRLPTLEPSWSRDATLTADLARTLLATQRYFRGQGVMSSLAPRPLAVGNVALMRTMMHLQAHDLATGELLWKVPHDEYAWINERPLYLENDAFRNGLIGNWHRRTEADSIFGSMSTDGHLVVIVQEPDRSRFELPWGGPTRPGPQTGLTPGGSRWNRLCAYEVSSGELRWQIGGQATGPADVYGGLSFLGSPLPMDDLLFGMARREDELRLLAIDRLSGHLRWSISLGILPPHLADALARRRVACPVSLVDGLLLCPTAAGALIAVDPVTRGIAWAFRYPLMQHDLPSRRGNEAAAQVADAWWNEWREVMCLRSHVSNVKSDSTKRGSPDLQGRRIAVLASPDADELHAIDLDKGSSLWSVSRGGALHLAGIADELAIVIEPSAVRAHDLRTGVVRWRCETGEVSGRGTIVGTVLLQPRRDGGVAIIELADGSRRDGLATSEVILGMLVPCEGGWVSQTDQALVRLPMLDVTRRETLAKWNADPTNETAALELARLDLQAGEAGSARSRLVGIDTSSAKALRRETLLALLRTSFGKSIQQPGDAISDRKTLGDELLALCESNDERLVALRALGEAASSANNAVEALTLLLDGLDLLDTTARKSIGEWPADGVSTRSVRRDRVFVGAIERVLARTMQRAKTTNAPEDAAVMRQLDETLATRLEAARQNSDPFAVQRLVDRLLPLEWGRRTLLAESSSVQFARSLKKSETALLAVAGAHDAVLASQAAEQLAELFSRSGWRTEADAILRRLLVEHPDSTPAKKLATDPTEADRRARLLAPPTDSWPNVVPWTEVESKRHMDVYHVSISVDAAPGSLLDRLDVSVERQGRTVRFVGEGHDGAWTIALPGPVSQMRTTFASHDQCEAWGVGRLLVLRLGSELFGISPLDERGEPHASMVWQLDTAGALTSLANEALWSIETIPARVGLRHERLLLVDGFGRALGRVGPVRPDYLCYQSQAKLVALDTQTGKRLWERLDLPPRCLTFGDEDRVYLWRTAERSLQVLSAIDGHTIEERPWDVSSDDVLMQRGSLTWVALAGPKPRLELHDARDNSIRWASDFPVKAVPFVLDCDTLGIVEPEGSLRLVSARTGQQLGEIRPVEVPKNLDRIVSHSDSWRWYIALSEPVPRHASLQAEQLWGGRRLPFLNGTWCAIDRSTRSIAWKRPLGAEPLPLDAARGAPVFVQAFKQPALDNPGSRLGEGVLRVIDKRTGGEIASRRDSAFQPYFVLHPAGNREMLEIWTERETVRLKYNPMSDKREGQ